MDDKAIAEAVDLLAGTRLELKPFAGFPAGCAPRAEGEGYAIQNALHERLAGKLGQIAGYKIGCTTKVMQDYMKIDHPCSGGIFESTIHRGELTAPYSRWVRIGVECEMAAVLSRPLSPANAPFDREAVADVVDHVMAAIELVDDRYADFRALDVGTLVADDFFGAGCVLGETLADWRSMDLSAMRGVMEINGVEAGTGTGADVLGHPFEALALLANELAARGETIEEGAVIMTGSIVQTVWLNPGDRVTCRLEGLGEVSLTVEG